MKAIISADSAITQAEAQGSVARKMKGRAGVLESEIKQDVIRGDDVEAKNEELAEMQQKVAQAETAQINILADANNELEAAAKADQQTEPTNAKDEKIDNKDTISNKKVDTTVDTEEGKNYVDTDFKPEAINTDGNELADASVSETVSYTHVDVRL